MKYQEVKLRVIADMDKLIDAYKKAETKGAEFLHSVLHIPGDELADLVADQVDGDLIVRFVPSAKFIDMLSSY
jgi:hypothetical protein